MMIASIFNLINIKLKRIRLSFNLHRDYIIYEKRFLKRLHYVFELLKLVFPYTYLNIYYLLLSCLKDTGNEK